jgi:hypothetical protein
MKRFPIMLAVALAILVGNHVFAQEQAVFQEEKAEGRFAEIHGIRM